MSQLREILSDLVDRFSTFLKSDMSDSIEATAKDDAKNRLKLVLMHDRSKLSQGDMENMRNELIDVISRYVEIDKELLDLNLEDEEGSIALIANIPVLRGTK